MSRWMTMTKSAREDLDDPDQAIAPASRRSSARGIETRRSMGGVVYRLGVAGGVAGGGVGGLGGAPAPFVGGLGAAPGPFVGGLGAAPVPLVGGFGVAGDEGAGAGAGVATPGTV